MMTSFDSQKLVQLWAQGVRFLHKHKTWTPRPSQNKPKAASVNMLAMVTGANLRGRAGASQGGVVRCVCVLAKDLSSTWLKCVKLTNDKILKIQHGQI